MWWPRAGLDNRAGGPRSVLYGHGPRLDRIIATWEVVVPNRTVRTTVALPADLIAAADRVVREGRARSRSALLATALQHELAALDRSALDAAFAPLADDLDYQSEAIILSEEFAAADWEALQLGKD